MAGVNQGRGDHVSVHPQKRVKGSMDDRKIKVLLVEDNPGDVLLVQIALERLGVEVGMQVAPDGQSAIDRLLQAIDSFDIVILDLNLPVKSGREVLVEMTLNPRLRKLPVAILTSSTSKEDAALCLGKERCLFFVKTPDLVELQRIVAQIHAYALQPSPN